MKKTILSLIGWYQRYLSLDTGTLGKIFPVGKVCRYTPTCSQYTYEAVAQYGILYGLWLGGKRVWRCNPWSEGGWDPMPDIGKQATSNKRQGN